MRVRRWNIAYASGELITTTCDARIIELFFHLPIAIFKDENLTYIWKDIKLEVAQASR